MTRRTRGCEWRWPTALLRTAVIACAGALACGSGPRPGTTATKAPSLDGVTRRSLQVELPGPWARQYGAASAHQLSEVEAAIVAELTDLPIILDRAASQMVREVARSAPDRVNVPAELVDGLGAWAGVTDPPPRLVVVELPTGACAEVVGPECHETLKALATEVRATLPTTTEIRFGVGVARAPSGATRMVVGLFEHGVALAPVAAVQPRGASFWLRGHLLGDRRDPSIEVARPDGTVLHAEPEIGQGAVFSARIHCDAGPGTYQVEVLAEGRHGPEVTANFPVFCGVRPPRVLVAEVETVGPQVVAEQVAMANFQLLNQARRARGLPELVWDDRAAVAALAHSRDMLRSGFVGHRSPSTGDVAARLEAARVPATVVRENVARGYGPSGIHSSLMGSPGHRANILAGDVSRVGIGAALGEPESTVAGAMRPVFLTQVFFRAPGDGAPKDSALAPNLRARVDRVRRDAGLPTARWDRRVDAIARRLVEDAVAGKAAPKGWEQAIFALGYASVEQHQVSSADFEALATLELWRQARLVAGLALVRTAEGKFVMVVLTVAA